jgi:hypothetical protein
MNGVGNDPGTWTSKLLARLMGAEAIGTASGRPMYRRKHSSGELSGAGVTCPAARQRARSLDGPGLPPPELILAG